MEKDEILYSKDGRCPHCDSDNVMFTGRIDSDPGASSTGKYPELRHKRWKCNNCKKIFYFNGE